MSRNQDLTGPDANAFEYVLGTLPGNERAAFERAMATDPTLAERVRYWEGQLMALQNPEHHRPPAAGTWEAIEQRIGRAETAPARRGVWTSPIWGLAASLLLALSLSLTWLWYSDSPAHPNSDYVAVLADESGKPQLTALTLAGGETLWLQWEAVDIPDSASLQLWAVSRRDGQARSIAVFDQAKAQTLALDQAARRLIVDADHLLLTREPDGGSPLDLPSDEVVAKGACVRLSAG